MFPNQTLGKNIYIYILLIRGRGGMVLPVVQEIFGFPVPRKETLLETRSQEATWEKRGRRQKSVSPVPAFLKLLSYSELVLPVSVLTCLSVERLFWKKLVQFGGEVGIQRHLHLVCGFFSS